jgi:hypothetical protein
MPETKSELMNYEAMALGRRFAPLEFRVDTKQLRAYGAVIGKEPSNAPTGLLAMYARLAYLTEGVMPSGGVMASLGIDYHAPLPLETAMVARAVVTDRKERRSGGWVTIDVEFASDSEVIATARVLGVWPL